MPRLLPLMRFISPNTGAREITLAEEQLEYNPMVVALYKNSNYPGTTMFLCRVRLTPTERLEILNGEDLFITQLAFPNKDNKVNFAPLDVQVGMQHFKIDPIEESDDQTNTG